MDGWTKENVAVSALVACFCLMMITLCLAVAVDVYLEVTNSKPTTRHSQTIELKAE